MSEEMEADFTNNFINPNDFSNYDIGGNITNAFAIGEIGAQDDFFLVGAPAEQVDDYPILTGNFLDSEGNQLFRLVKNTLVVNPRNCSKMRGDHIGFEIHDGEGNSIFKVESLYENLRYRTIITGTFYGKGGKVIAKANKGSLSWVGKQKMVMGFSGSGFGMRVNFSDMEAELAKWCIASAGEIHQIVSGEIVGKQFDMDGTVFVNAVLRNCQVRVLTGNFVISGSFAAVGGGVTFDGPAGNVHGIIMASINAASRPLVPSGNPCIEAATYRSSGCDHQTEITVNQGDILPACPQCGKNVMWKSVGPV